MRIIAEFRDEDGVLVDPTTPTVVIKMPDGVEFFSGIMDKTATGMYKSDVQTEFTSDIGYWTVTVWGLYGTKRITEVEKIQIVEVI